MSEDKTCGKAEGYLDKSLINATNESQEVKTFDEELMKLIIKHWPK